MNPTVKHHWVKANVLENAKRYAINWGAVDSEVVR
jgi:hypothetical protein